MENMQKQVVMAHSEVLLALAQKDWEKLRKTFMKIADPIPEILI